MWHRNPEVGTNKAVRLRQRCATAEGAYFPEVKWIGAAASRGATGSPTWTNSWRRRTVCAACRRRAASPRLSTSTAQYWPHPAPVLRPRLYNACKKQLDTTENEWIWVKLLVEPSAAASLRRDSSGEARELGCGARPELEETGCGATASPAVGRAGERAGGGSSGADTRTTGPPRDSPPGFAISLARFRTW